MDFLAEYENIIPKRDCGRVDCVLMYTPMKPDPDRKMVLIACRSCGRNWSEEVKNDSSKTSTF